MAGGQSELSSSEMADDSADEIARIRAILHGVRNPLAAGRLELQLARRSEEALARALDSGDVAQMRRELSALVEALQGIEEGVTEACARLDDVERQL